MFADNGTTTENPSNGKKKPFTCKCIGGAKKCASCESERPRYLKPRSAEICQAKSQRGSSKYNWGAMNKHFYSVALSNGGAVVVCPACSPTPIAKIPGEILEHFWTKHAMLPIHIG